MEDPTVPESPSIPLLIPLVSPQGNNIMLVASQPALQSPERKSYEIVLREVRRPCPPCVWPSPPLALEPGFEASYTASHSPILTSKSSASAWKAGLGGRGAAEAAHKAQHPHPHLLLLPHPGILASV